MVILVSTYVWKDIHVERTFLPETHANSNIPFDGKFVIHVNKNTPNNMDGYNSLDEAKGGNLKPYAMCVIEKFLSQVCVKGS